MKIILNLALRLGVLTLLLFIINTITSLVLKLDRFQSSSDPTNTALMALLACFLQVIAITYPVVKSKWGGWRLAIMVFLVIFGIRTLLTQIETLVFLRYLVVIVPEGMVSLLFLEGILVAGLFSPFVVLVLKKLNPTDSPQPVMIMPVKVWVLKLLLLGVVYVIIYIFFGMFVFRPLAGSAFDTFYKDLQMPPWILPFQVVRGIIWSALAILVLTMMQGKCWKKGLAVALLFSVLMGSLLLIPNGLMPDQIRVAHFVEVSISNFLFGWIVVWVLHKRNF